MVHGDIPEMEKVVENTTKIDEPSNRIILKEKEGNVQVIPPETQEKKEKSKEKEPEFEIELNFETLTLMISELEKEVRIWRNRREKLNNQVVEKSKIRNEKNSLVSEFIKKAKSEKEERDKANDILKELKSKRIKVEQSLKDAESHLEEADAKIQSTDNKIRPRHNMGSQLKQIEKSINDLEWKLQTNTLNIEDERRVVDRIAQLDSQLEQLSEYKGLSDEKRKAFYQVRHDRRDLRNIIREMNKFVKESRIHHKAMVESYSMANKTRKEADKIHHELITNKTEADKIHKEFVEKIKTKRRLTKKLREITKKEKEIFKERELVKTNIIKENALQKSKDGKKISFEEFKALIDRGLV